MSADWIRVVGEVEPGIPICELHAPLGILPLVIKAGGFGDVAVFARCLDVLKVGAAP
jgi:uncharacterized protein YgbK (DUF1537 family)